MKTRAKKAKGLIFVISGPSGSGKTTLGARILLDNTLQKKLAKSISLTTRPMRSVEKEKKDYFFVSEKDFFRKRRAKKILEWTRYLGYYYATPRDFLEKQLQKGKHVLLCLDLRGALKVRRLYPMNSVLIFILPPSLAELHTRIRKRCHKTTPQEIRRRLMLADKEMKGVSQYDYKLVNKDLKQGTQKLKEIILDEIRSAGKIAG